MTALPDPLEALRAPGDDDAATLTALHRRLEAGAATGDLLDVAYAEVDSPIGPLLLAGTPRGLVKVAFASEGRDAALQTLAAQLSPRVLHAPARLDEARRELDEYFAGRRRTFELPLDFSLTRGFRGLVQRRLADIAYGQTDSYRGVAEHVGNPKAVRAVGTACATNPLPIVLPCHRVLRSDGSLGGYGGGLDAKRTLLALEQEG